MPSHQFHWNANLMKWKPTHNAPMICRGESRDHDYCNGLHYDVRLVKNTWRRIDILIWTDTTISQADLSSLSLSSLGLLSFLSIILVLS
jgi:hypothetical protein